MDFNAPLLVPKRKFNDYRFANLPDYNLKFDSNSGQPIMKGKGKQTVEDMNRKLIAVQQEIAKRKFK